jgi:hypothetical protein
MYGDSNFLRVSLELAVNGTVQSFGAIPSQRHGIRTFEEFALISNVNKATSKNRLVIEQVW